MQYCTIEYAGGVTVNNNAAFRLDNAAPYIKNCTIQKNTKPGINAWNYTKTLRLDSCTIQNNTTGIDITGIGGAIAILNACIIANNTAKGYSGNNLNNRIKNCIINTNLDGIYITTTTSIDSIINNTTNGNQNYGIYYLSSTSSNSNFSNCTINNNTISNNSYGIYYYSDGQSNSSICTTNNNDISNNSGYGISYSSSSSSPSNFSTSTFSNNTISTNQGYGISFFSYSSSNNYSTATFNNNTISNNSSHGIYYSSYSSYTFSSSCTIDNNTIRNNSGCGIFYSSSSSDNNYSTCIISNNRINNNISDGIYYKTYAYPINSSACTINNNRINNNNGRGLYFEGCKTINISKNKIINNQSTKGAGIYIVTITGIYVNYAITQNVIADNKATQEGGGVYMDIAQETSNVFQNNSLINNHAPNSSAFYYQGAGLLQANKNTMVWNNTTGTAPTRAVFIGTYSAITYITLMNNNIYNNNSNNPFYEFWFAGTNSDSINARYNYWNQTTLTSVNNVIFDYLDSSILGRVYCNPFLTSPDTSAPVTPVQNLTKTQVGNNVQLTWTANLETDLAGYNVYWGSPSGYFFSNVVNAGNVTSYMLVGANVADTIEVTAYDTQANGVDDQLEGNESWFKNYDLSGFVPIPITNANESRIDIFPNPNTGIFMLDINGFQDKEVQVKVLNMHGAIVYLDSKGGSNDKYPTEIDLRKISAGVYIVIVNTSTNQFYKKIIIE